MQATAQDLMRPALTVAASSPVYEALRMMRETRDHIAVVQDLGADSVGLITISAVLHRLRPADPAGQDAS